MDRARQRGKEIEANMSIHTKEILLYMTWTLNLLLLGLMESFPKEEISVGKRFRESEFPGKTSTYFKCDRKS